MAVRRSLWCDLNPIDDSDFTTPLDVILQGYRLAYAEDAIAYDMPPSSVKAEFRARIRQTSKNLIGTIARWGWQGCMQHPMVSLSILSHKILRWLTPLLMLSIMVSNLFLLRTDPIYGVLFVMQVSFYALALAGLLAGIFNRKIMIASPIFSFCVAAGGMAVGIIKGISGRAPAAYKTEE